MAGWLAGSGQVGDRREEVVVIALARPRGRPKAPPMTQNALQKSSGAREG